MADSQLTNDATIPAVQIRGPLQLYADKPADNFYWVYCPARSWQHLTRSLDHAIKVKRRWERKLWREVAG